MSFILKQTGKLEEARKCYMEAICIEKNSNSALGGLGQILLMQRKHLEGLANLRLAWGSIFFNINDGCSVEK